MSETMSSHGTGGPDGPGESLSADEAGGSRGRRPGLVIAAVVAAVALVGGGAFAAWSFFAQGPQPARALPATTLGYLALDANPSGGQKIEAFRTLRKFPGLRDELGLDEDDDLRRIVVEAALEDSDCDLDFDDDIDPWLGDKVAFAAVPTGAESIDDLPFSPVFALHVTDEDAADTGLRAIAACTDEDEVAWAQYDSFAILAPTQAEADAVVDAAQDGTLADDDGFGRWTDEVGADGIVTGYLAPEAAELLLDAFADFTEAQGDLLGSLAAPSPSADPFEGLSDEELADLGIDPALIAELRGGTDEPASPDPGAIADQLEQQRQLLEDGFADFDGAALSVRFASGELRADAAAGGIDNETLGTGSVGDLMARLPAATGAALGYGLGEGWADYLVTTLGEDAVAEAEAATGLDFPEDLEAVLGDGVALAVGDDIDIEEFTNTFDPTTLPVALAISGDPARIRPVVDKLLAAIGPDASLLTVEESDDIVAIGLAPAWVEEVAGGGDLGGTETFQRLVPGGDDTASAFFVDVDGPWFDSLLDGFGGAPTDLRENLEPLSGLGISSQAEGDRLRLTVRLATD